MATMNFWSTSKLLFGPLRLWSYGSWIYKGLLRTKLYDNRGDFNFHIVNSRFICSNILAVICIWSIYLSGFPPWLGWPLCNICITNDHRYVPLVVRTSRYFPYSWLITGAGFTIVVTCAKGHVGQEGGTFQPNNFFYDGFCLCAAVLNLKAFLSMYPGLTLSAYQVYPFHGPSKRLRTLTGTGPHLS
jgi:hypothetical protein